MSLNDHENFRKADVSSSTNDDISDLTRKLGAAADAIAGVRMKLPYSPQEMSRWGFEILGDGELDPAAKVFAWYISLRTNRKDGSAYPGLDLIAKETKMAKKTIIAAREQLRARGHLHIELGRPGYKSSTHYWPTRWRVTHSTEREVSNAKPLSDVDKSPKDVLHAKHLPQGERRFRGEGETFPNRPRHISHGKHEPFNNLKEPLKAPNGASAAVERARHVNGLALNGTPTSNQPLRRMPKYDRSFIPNGNQGDIEREIEKHLGDRGHEGLEKYAGSSPEGFKRLITLFRRDEAAALASEEFLSALQACSQAM